VPNAAAGRWSRGPSPTPPRAPDSSEPMIHVPGVFLHPFLDTNLEIEPLWMGMSSNGEKRTEQCLLDLDVSR
jgi:hypothetical protein